MAHLPMVARWLSTPEAKMVEPMVREVIDPATWDRASWFAGMGERATELIAQGTDGNMLARFEATANAWLAGQGVPDPPFRIISELRPTGVV
jgi:hypothetical protein